MPYNKSYGKTVKSAGKPKSRRTAEENENSPLNFDWTSVMDYGQNLLTAAGMTPLFGNVADGLNVAISGGRAAYAKHVGDEDAYKHHRNSAAINAAAAIPGAGLAVGAGKLAKAGITAAKGSKTASKSTKALNPITQTAKNIAESKIISEGVDIADKATIKPEKEQIVKRKVKNQNNFA